MALGTMLSATISLVGGLVMCLYTSWKLRWVPYKLFALSFSRASRPVASWAPTHYAHCVLVCHAHSFSLARAYSGFCAHGETNTCQHVGLHIDLPSTGHHGCVRKLVSKATTSVHGSAHMIRITLSEWRWLVRRSSNLNRQIFAAMGDSMASATEALQSIRTVRSFSAEEHEEGKFRTHQGIALKKGVKDAYGATGTTLLTSLSNMSAGVLILWYGGYSVLTGEGGLTIGSLITFQLYWNMISNSYQQLNNVLVQFTVARGAAARVFEMIESLPDVDIDAGLTLTRDMIAGKIELREIEFSYQMRNAEKVLSGVNLTIGAGQVCAFVGKSGGGKSTLVHLLMRFYDPQAGTILLDGRPLDSINLRSLHMQMGAPSCRL